MRLHLCHFVSFISATCFALAMPASRTTEVLATYEDIPDSLVAVPITNNKGLNYENWSFASTGAIQVGGLESKSPNSRVGAAGPIGQPALTPQTPQYKAFSPRFFSFGCVLRSGQTAATVATGCTVTVDGFDAKGNKVATASFTFDPPLKPISPVQMRDATLPNSFNQPLTRVVFSYPTQLLAIFLADNLGYKLYT